MQYVLVWRAFQSIFLGIWSKKIRISGQYYCHPLQQRCFPAPCYTWALTILYLMSFINLTALALGFAIILKPEEFVMDFPPWFTILVIPLLTLTLYRLW